MDSGGPKEPCIRWGPDLPPEGTVWRGMMSEFSRMPLSTIPSGPDLGISPRVVDHRTDWPAAHAVKYK